MYDCTYETQAQKITELKEQLQEAKGFIKLFVGVLKNLKAENEEIVIKAEQFLEYTK